MANETTFAALEGTLGHDYLILAEEVLSARYGYDNVRDCVLTRDIGSMDTDQVRFPKYPALSAGALTDGTDLTAFTQFTPTQAAATVAEVGLKLILTDLARTSAALSDGNLAQEAGKAVLEKMNTDICALGSGFSTTTVGATTVDLSETNFEDAIIGIMGNKAPDDLFAVLHPRQWFDLVNSIGSVMPAATGGTPREATNDFGSVPGGMGGILYGVDVRVNPLVPTANAGADRQGFIGVKNRTIGGAIKWFVRPEFERDASYRGTETVVTACYAFIEVEDESGASITSDA